MFKCLLNKAEQNTTPIDVGQFLPLLDTEDKVHQCTHMVVMCWLRSTWSVSRPTRIL